MIEVFIDEESEEKKITITGHAEYAEHGRDILCASVSTIFQLATMGLKTLAVQYPEHIVIKETTINKWERGECSNCGCPVPTDSRLDFMNESDSKYCYNCGRKMEVS